MTVLEILSSASALICEKIGAETAEDYSERTPYIMASFCTQCKGVDTKYRKAMGLAPIVNYGKATMPRNGRTGSVILSTFSMYCAMLLFLFQTSDAQKRSFLGLNAVFFFGAYISLHYTILFENNL